MRRMRAGGFRILGCLSLLGFVWLQKYWSSEYMKRSQINPEVEGRVS
jgi:hypothetical protein